MATTRTTSKAKAAIEAEAASETDKTTEFSFEYDGENYTVSFDDFSDLDVMEAFEENRHCTAVKTLLGPDQWGKFKSKKRNIKELAELTDIIFEGAKGLQPGE